LLDGLLSIADDLREMLFRDGQDPPLQIS
jgi:hypothetical protein